MKKRLLITVMVTIAAIYTDAQVTQINSNKSLHFESALDASKVFYVSDVDQTLWITDGTSAGTRQLSSEIEFQNGGGVVNGKFIFRGYTVGTGAEMYVSDGTVAGTVLLKDIFPGITGSTPDDDVALLNGNIYFTAARPADGRELWKTNGTPNGTVLVKDIIAGTTGSNDPNRYDLFSNGSYLLFKARTGGLGTELYKSDGTAAGTALLKDIYTGALSSDAAGFQVFNNLVLFEATDAQHGKELWKTDGSIAGTVLLKDINPGAGNGMGMFGSTYHFIFKNKAYFTADNGTTGEEIWVTDGTEANTKLLKDIEPGPPGSFNFLPNAINLGNKFIFPSTDFHSSRFELWESDGTIANTKLFKSFDGDGVPFILPNYDFNSPTPTQVLFKGNKFFMMASTAANGYELWISDGTFANTTLVKDIHPTGDALQSLSFVHTSNALYFNADDGVHGDELWKSDGTANGTSMVADINPAEESSTPWICPMLVGGRIVFEATNGDNTATDMYAVNGIFTSPLPVKLAAFTVTPSGNDALLQWQTELEINTANFRIQRSYDAVNFETIGTVAAAGNSSANKAYRLTDVDALTQPVSVVYYRLQMIDTDNRIAESKIVAVQVKRAATWTMQLLGNPVKDNVYLSLRGIHTNVNVVIAASNGQVILKTTLANNNGLATIALPALQHGTYVLTVLANNDKKSVRFVK